MIKVEPLPQLLQQQSGVFPLNLPLIDRSNPFFIDIALLSNAQPRLEKSISLEVEYHDLAGNLYIYETVIESSNSALPVVLRNDESKEIVRTLKSINDTLTRFPKK